MAELVVSMVVGPLLSLVKEKASSYLLEQYKVMEGMEEQHKILKRKLPAILDVITDAEEKATHREGVKAWLEDVKTVAYEANEAFDEFSYEALRREAKEKGHIRKLGFEGVKLFPTHNRVAFRNKMGNKLRRIVQTIEVLVAEMNAFGFNYQQQAPASKHWRQTDPIIIDPGNIAHKSRDEEKQKIVKMLFDNASNADLTVLPIFGMGGMGKTTLAQLIYNDLDVQKQFTPCRWVCVSDDFDVCSIINKICDSSSGTNLEKAFQNFEEEHSEKRYLLVLDDVWNEDANKWEKLKACLKQGGMGSVVLTTTRKKGIAELMGTVKAHNIVHLDDKFIKQIIETKAFSSKESKPDELEKMVDDFAKKCHGSPLAANALGSVLRCKTSKEEWDSVLRKSIAHNKEDQILPILKLSYDDLPSHIKQCFSFCAVFPKDHEIDMEFLIQLWMANGFVPIGKDIHLETTGKHIFNELVSRSFFQDVKQIIKLNRKDDSVYRYFPKTTCKIHDLMHDVALSAMENEVATIITDEKPKQSEFLQNTCRHLFLSCHELEAILNDSLKTRSPAIQTLLCTQKIKSSLHHLEKYNSVRALSLRQSNGTFLLKPKYLHHLRYLDVSYSDIESLPKDISILYHLHAMDVSYCKNLGQLPKELKYMTALCHLYTHGCRKLKGMPPNLGQLTSLRTLTYFVVGIGSDCSSIGELQHLNDLGGELLLSQLENVTQEADAKLSNLGNKKELRALSFRWTSTEEEKPHCHRVLEGLEAPHGLKALRINDYPGTKFPRWMGMLPNMVELHLYDCKKSKNLPPLWQVPALEVLCLEGLEQLQCLCSGGTFFMFPNLKELNLVGLPAFDRWCEVNWLQGEQVIFPHLEKLSIKKCNKLTTLPEAAALRQSCGQNNTELRSAFPALKILKLKFRGSFQGWEAIEVTQGHQIMFPHLEKLSIRSCQKLITLPEAPLLGEFCGGYYKMARSAFPALEVLKLKYLKVFQRWGAADEATNQGQQIIFPRLENLSIETCKNLVALPEGPLLQELCGGDYKTARSAFPALKVLKLEKLEVFQRWGGADEAIQEQQIMFPHLENLSIERCKNLVALSEGPLLQELFGGDYKMARSAFPALLVLKLENLQNFQRWGAADEAIQGQQIMFPHLEDLSIERCKNLVALPEGPLLQELFGGDYKMARSAFPALLVLKLESLENFQRWGAADEAIQGQQIMFPHLEDLSIERCKNLVALPEGPLLQELFGGDYKMARSAFPALLMLQLESLQNFQRWGAADEATQGQQIIFPRLENLSIGMCQNLIALPEGPLLQELCGGDYEKARSAFPALKVLRLNRMNNFERWEEVEETLGEGMMFPHLEDLGIVKCPKMTALPIGTSLAPSFGHSDITARSALPKLKRLHFDGVKNFESWGVTEAFDGDQCTFPDLETVFIRGSPELKTLPEGPKLSSLEIHHGHPHILAAIPRVINSLSELKYSCAAATLRAVHGAFEPVDVNNNIKSPLTRLELGRGCNLLFHSSALALWTCFVQLQYLRICYCNELVYWPEKSFQSLVSLRTLIIRDCNDLIGYARGAPGQPASERSQLLPNLKSLDIWDCENLVDVFNVPASLKTMYVRDCPKLESIFGEPSSTSDHFLPCLESLTIRRCDSLPEVLNLPSSLRKIDLYDCGELKFLSGQLDGLQSLNIDACPKLISLESSSGELQTLERLFLQQCKSLASFLPNGPQAYSSLHSLAIKDCPCIKSLPSFLRQRLDSIEWKNLDAHYDGTH